jgi:phosphatidylglycerol---prolipoprotein diacylglyceryl transferase
MTVYPLVLHVGAFTITGYGLMMMAGFLVGGWVYAAELARRGLDTTIAWDTVVFAIVGGLAGSKLYYAISVGRLDAFFTRGGLVWYGGFIGGTASVFAFMWWKRLHVRTLLDAVSPALAVGYLLGRVGCFLVNDDYGRPTTVPWGMRFPHGAPPSTAANLVAQFHVALPPGTPPGQVLAVHPTQLYEITLTFVVFVLLWRWRERRHAAGWLFGAYLVLSSLERIVVELFRAKDDRILGPVSVAQLLSVGLVGIGAWLMRTYAAEQREEPTSTA